MSELLPVLKQRHLDANGDPLAGGLLYSYEAGTSTPKATYTDESLVTPNTNPLVLDANGYGAAWFGVGTWKFVLSDANDIVQFTVDNVQTLSSQIAEQINVAGALAAASNLSDLTNVAAARKNLGISPMTYQNDYAITGGQSATDLTLESFDGTIYSSVECMVEITQGTTVHVRQFFSLHYLNSVWRKLNGETRDTGVQTGVSITLGAQAGSVVKLQASETGVGNGKVRIKKSYFLVTP